MPIKLPLPILRRNSIQSIAHILSDILIPILIQTQCTARMLYKQVEQPNLIVLDLWEFARYGVSYEVGTPRFGREGEGFLEPCHAGGLERV